MKRRTIDMVIKHHRNTSVSSLGSGDWGSDVGASVEDCSTGDQSASSQSRGLHVVAEMTIVASSSPEIEALTRRRSDGFQSSIHSSNILPSPGSSVASSTVSRTSISVTSMYEVDRDTEESKRQDIDGASKPTHTHNNIDQNNAQSFDNLRIEPPPAPRRKQVDIASIINSDTKDAPKRYNPRSNGFDSNGTGHGQRARWSSLHATRSSQREGITPATGSQRPPKPLKTLHAARSPVRRPSMHRRVSFDSLPTPSEIGASSSALFHGSASERHTLSTQSFTRGAPHFSSVSERGQKASQRRGTNRLAVSRSHGKSKFGY